MMLTRRATLAGLAACGLPAIARAQAFPSRAITIVVPYTPAGPVDTTARLVGQEMAADLGQPVVIENRPGGSGIIGTNAVARATPDGYTLVSAPTRRMSPTRAWSRTALTTRSATLPRWATSSSRLTCWSSARISP